MDLSFLKNVQLKPIEVKTAEKRVRTVEGKNPTTADIRVYNNGKIYPSLALVDEYKLEYAHRDASAEAVENNEFGFDIFSSLKWGMIMGQLPQELIFISPIAKSEPKVSLWGACRFNEDGTPKSSVVDQGMSSFCKDEFMPMLTAVYGIDWENTRYVDLVINREEIIQSPNKVYHLPKVVSSGPKKGKDDYITRENIIITPLTVAHTEIIDVNKVAVEAEHVTAPGPNLIEEDVYEEIKVEQAASLPVSNSSGFTLSEREEELTQEIQAEQGTPFDESVPPPAVGSLFQDPGEDWANDLQK